PNATGTPEPMLRDRPTPAAGGAATGARPTGEPDLLRGTFATSYRFRHGAGASDHNLTARLNLDIGREEREPFSFHFAGPGFANLDGRRDDDPFRGLEQSFRDDIHGRIYRAYFAARAPLPYVARLRLGRQDLDAAPVPVTFDGLCADSDEFGAAKVSVSAWGGIPVHHFEPSSRGDSAYGVGAGMRPWQGGRLRFDWQSLRDDFLAIERHDEVLGLRAWQSFDALQLTALHTWLNGRPREVQVGAHGELPFELFVDVDYRELLRTQRSQVNELDPFYVIAAEYRPYRQLQLSLSRDFGKHLTLSSGGQVRRLSEASDEGTFNRDFERCWADASFPGLFGVDRLTGFVNGSLWHTSGEATRAVAGGLQYRTDDGLRLELGSGYDLFRYDVLADRERVHVRTFYLRADYALAGRVRLDATYELERNDDDEFHLLRLGMTWTL
ncbi:MAG: hypothetical protein KDE27_28690, partial [Planctomycetes bacterium]|nr:hypothetical protein [Planctomycetota bacterium]